MTRVYRVSVCWLCSLFALTRFPFQKDLLLLLCAHTARRQILMLNKRVILPRSFCTIRACFLRIFHSFPSCASNLHKYFTIKRVSRIRKKYWRIFLRLFSTPFHLCENIHFVFVTMNFRISFSATLHFVLCNAQCGNG